MDVNNILAAIKSLKLALRQSFVLKSQCTVLREAVELLEQDVKSESAWYQAGEKLCDQLLRFLKKFLRFARINLKVTEARSKGLGELRKARSLCNVSKLREKLNGYSSELQLYVFSSKIQQRIGQQLGQLLSGMSLGNAYNTDKSQIIVLFKEVFESLQKLPDMDDARRVYDELILPLEQKDPYDVNIEDFNDPQLAEFSHKLEHRLLGMTTQDPTPFEALRMEKMYRTGRFGEIFTGTLGGPVPVCIQKIKPEMLQTLSSDGRIKLFSTIRGSLVKGHDNLVKVIGVTMYDDTLYVALQNINFSLSDLLHGVGGVGPRTFTPDELLYTFFCITSALEFLQKDGVVHGDLTPENIFFSREATRGFVRLANFSYELNLEELHWSTWNEESIAYQAPEVLGQKSFSAASDVYALAICIWESTQDNARPYGNKDKTHIVEEVKAGQRPEFTGHTREAGWLVNLAQRCWSPRPWLRPGVTTIRSELELVASDNGKVMDDLGTFVAPLVKKTQQEVAANPTRSPPRPIPGIEAPPSPPRPLPGIEAPLSPPRPGIEAPLSPPRPIPGIEAPPSPPRQIPSLVAPPSPVRGIRTQGIDPVSPMRILPSFPKTPTSPQRPIPSVPTEPTPGQNTRAIPRMPGGQPRELPPTPGVEQRPLPVAPDGSQRRLPGIPGETHRPLPANPVNNNTTRPLPGIKPEGGRQMLPPMPDRGPPNKPTRPMPGLPKTPARPTPSTGRQIPPRPIPGVEETNDTLHRMQDQYHKEEPSSPEPQATGVNGLSAEEVRKELIRFYEENDPDMLKELNNLVNWCMVNGLEQFEKLLVERFGKGLPMFNGDQESEPEAEEKTSQGVSRGRGGLASIFTRRKPKQPTGGKSAVPVVPQRPPGLFKP